MIAAGAAFAHPEAFCLMQYRADDGSEIEVLWNSRDGVTPFVISLKSGKSATHVDWGQDVRCSPQMASALGVRVFADHTEETSRRAAVEYVDHWWDHPAFPMSTRYASKDEAAARFAADWVGSPTILEGIAVQP